MFSHLLLQFIWNTWLSGFIKHIFQVISRWNLFSIQASLISLHWCPLFYCTERGLRYVHLISLNMHKLRIIIILDYFQPALTYFWHYIFIMKFSFDNREKKSNSLSNKFQRSLGSFSQMINALKIYTIIIFSISNKC